MTQQVSRPAGRPSNGKTVLFTGGGSAGHVTPNLALMARLAAEGYTLCYIGSQDGIERALITGHPYYAISTGKLRRYFSLRNLTDPFRVLRGVFQARRIIRHVKPDVVFSKGGFVSVPVVLAARGCAPIVTHESDYTPGLANRITARCADTVCVTFADTLKNVKGGKGLHTGTPIRPALYAGDRARGLAFAELPGEKPVLLVMGGSQGAQALNDALAAALPRLLTRFEIIHLCGKGKRTDTALPGYAQFEYVDKELPDLFAAAELVLSRAGANAVFELLALCKPALLVPLPRSVSRGDQLLNAAYFARMGYARVLQQEALTGDSLCAALFDLWENRLSLIRTMAAAETADGTDEVLDIIRKYADTAQP